LSSLLLRRRRALEAAGDTAGSGTGLDGIAGARSMLRPFI